MAATQFAVVYGAASKVIRRIVHPDDDNYLAKVQANLASGEAVLVLLAADNPTKTVAALQSKIGTPTHSGICAKIDGQGKVVNLIKADPQVDVVPGFQLVQTDIAQIGWTYSGGIFLAPVNVQPVGQSL